MDVPDTKRIVIVGKSGAGKSSLANTIFGDQVFQTDNSPKSGTTKCKAVTKSVNGRRITLIDTPGLFDTNKSEEELKPEIVSCITECAPGPHAFLIVFKVDRFTEQEQAVINRISQYFSEAVLKYAVILFTHGDQLDEGKKIEEFVSQSEDLSDLVKKCGNRCHVIDNKYWKKTEQDEYRSNEFQVAELLNTFDKIVKENNGGCYTNEMLQKIERDIQNEETTIRQTFTNMSQEEVRNEAKKIVSARILIQLTGIGIGMLFGGLLGVPAMVTKLVEHLQSPKAVAVTLAKDAMNIAVNVARAGYTGYCAVKDSKSTKEAAEKAIEAVMKSMDMPRIQGKDSHRVDFCSHNMDELNTRKIVILGKTGVGKSSLANTIFGEKVFKTDHTINSGTRECEAQTRSVKGRNLTLIDTPGFFDTDRAEEDTKAEILRCITECAPGPHAFLIVLKVEKYTKQEKSVIEKVQQYFSEEALKYATVLFTHGDQLEELKIEEFVDQNDAMKDLVKKCGNRCHVIDNKYWNENLKDEYRNNQFQVEELLKTIDKIMLANKGSCYTNELLQAVQENIKQEEEEIRKSSGNMSGEEIRKKAKASVFKRFWIKLAGVTTGALIGALCGVAVMVGLVYTVLLMRAEGKLLKQAIEMTIGAAAGGAGAVAELPNTRDKMVNKEMAPAVEGEMQNEKVHIRQSSGNTSQEEISNGTNNILKNMCIKLTGPAAESLGEAFIGPAVVVLQDIMGAGRGAEKGMVEAEDTANSAEEEKENIINKIVRGALMQTPPGQGGEGGGVQVTERDGATSGVKPVSVPLTRIVMAGTAGAGKTIRVLKQYRIILLGKTGAGKSSLANTIFGEDAFKINHTPSECQAESKSVHGRRITLVDTPGFFDTDRHEEEVKSGILRCITECAPGPHAFLIVLKVEKFCKQEQSVINKICQTFSEEALKYAVVVFTHGDQFPEGTNIEEFVDQNKCLSDLVKKCGGRCHVVTNKYCKNQQGDYRSNQFQVAELLNTIDKIVMENKGGCYTNKMLQAVERGIEEKGIRSSVGKMPQGDTGYTPNNSVSKNMWIKLTGPAAESMAEAFFSTAVIVLQETVEGEAEKEGEDEDKVEEVE
ncbi:uncharacterized protein LOC111648921, partial [Seriola lalandi dorsalis]|uniref:uncharacterized protein LOC111648921 n=1 Tax=Seriola lalandi dorsalis TaxID=1841481 RepID=UPI000C6F99C0